jgi:hypothetical protein
VKAGMRIPCDAYIEPSSQSARPGRAQNGRPAVCKGTSIAVDRDEVRRFGPARQAWCQAWPWCSAARARSSSSCTPLFCRACTPPARCAGSRAPHSSAPRAA